MRVLVIGGGGREHAIAWKLSKCEEVNTVFVTPGNAGTCKESKLKNIVFDSPNKQDKIVEFAKNEKISLTVVGPEQYLADGIVDKFRKEGLKIVGPTKSAAQLEKSKIFAKMFMQRHRIPTSDYKIFSDSQLAKKYIMSKSFPIVIKADGLASGKGVTVANSLAEGELAIDNCLDNKFFGSSGNSIIIEEFVQGKEVSFISLTDGFNLFNFPTSQDHKRLLENDKGPNTGGMGAYSPVDWIDDELQKKIENTIMKPTVKGMRDEGIVFTGFLYAGLMIKPDRTIKVLEYNCRLGDPEAQILMMKVKGNFFDLLNSSVCNSMKKYEEIYDFWSSDSVIGVVASSKGYPEKPELGKEIFFPEKNEIESDTKIFHAGTQSKEGIVETSGGRVFCLTSSAKNLFDARTKAYSNLNKIRFEGMHFRKDIAKNVSK